MKRCQKCKVDLENQLFYNSKSSKDGLSGRCKLCDRLARKESRSRSPDTVKGYRRRAVMRKYKITMEEFELILDNQLGVCAICGTNNPLGEGNKKIDSLPHSFCVDHCHNTGKVRGLLCNPCNRGLGFLKDSSALLRKAANYIEQSK